LSSYFSLKIDVSAFAENNYNNEKHYNILKLDALINIGRIVEAHLAYRPP
jgi:hypothetical protein